MFKNINIFFPISLIIFIAIELFLVSNNLFQIGIFLYALYAVVLFYIDKKYIISFFVYSLPLLPIISTEHKLFQVLGPDEIIYGFSFLVLLYFQKTYLKTKRLNKYQKLSIKFVYFLFFVNLFIISKDILLGLDPDKTKGLFYILKISVRFFLYYASLILLIKLIYLEGIYDYILIGFKYCIITITLSMIYTRELFQMGAGINVKTEWMARLLSGEYQRYLGFYGAGGDENSVGIFLVAAFGFLLALYERTGDIKNNIVFMGFAVLGAFLTGSRTAVLAMSFIIFIFLVTNKSGYAKFAFLIIGVIFYFVFNEQIELVIQRFLDPSAIEAVDPNEEGRVGKWIIYSNWILNNLETIFIGNLRNIPFDRAPHNYFFYTLYHAGLFILIYFIILFYKLLRLISFKISPTTLKSAYYIIPFPFTLLTVDSFGSGIYLWLFLSIGAFYITANSNVGTPKKVKLS